jgi:arylsulfatase B
MRWRLLLLLTFAGCEAPACPPRPSGPVPASPGPDRGPNVLLVIADDVGVDAVSTWGTWPGAAPTPTLDALAAQGVVFERAWSNPVCAPSRASLLTGRHSFRTGVGEVLQPLTPGGGLPLAERTIAELLRDAAPVPRATAFVGKWHLGTPDVGGPDHPARQGFQRVRATQGNLLDGGAADGLAQGYWDWEKDFGGVLVRSSCYATESVLIDTLGAVAQLPEPWFIVSSFHAAHAPLHDPPQEVLVHVPAGDDAGRYLAMVRSVDATLGRLLDALHPDVRARTWVVFVGDNGPAVEISPRPLDADRAKGSVYEVGVHVPLLIAGPGLTPARVGAPVHLVDVLPTVAELAGVDPAALGPVDGVSLLPWLHGEVPEDRVVYTDLRSEGLDLRAARDQRYKLVRGRPFGDELYDLEGAWVEGEDLLQQPLTAETLRAWARLRRAMLQVEGG